MQSDALLPIRRVAVRAMAINRPLTVAVALMVLTFMGTAIGLLVDPRVITGAPAWLKPMKFAISISIYTATFVWLLGFVRGRRWMVRFVAWVTTVGLLIEMAMVVTQVVRGTTSHFNVSTPFDSAVWSIMGATIVCIWTAALVLAFVLLRQRLPDPAFAWALRLGILISLVGMGVAYLMTTPTAMQRTAARAGHGLPIAGAHSVGVADGGPGLPLLGWSTVGGDLRAPHFVGLHALQLMPLIGWLLARYGGRWTVGTRTALIWIAGLVYLGLVGILTWQALRGQPLIAPDGTTLAALGLLALAGTGAALGVVLRATPPGERRAIAGMEAAR